MSGALELELQHSDPHWSQLAPEYGGRGSLCSVYKLILRCFCGCRTLRVRKDRDSDSVHRVFDILATISTPVALDSVCLCRPAAAFARALPGMGHAAAGRVLPKPAELYHRAPPITAGGHAPEDSTDPV